MVNVNDFLKSGGKLPGDKRKAAFQLMVDNLAYRLIGILADAPSMEVRRRALEKARRMSSTR